MAERGINAFTASIPEALFRVAGMEKWQANPLKSGWFGVYLRDVTPSTIAQTLRCITTNVWEDISWKHSTRYSALLMMLYGAP